MKEQYGNDQNWRGGGPNSGAKRDGAGGDDPIDDKYAAEAEPAQGWDDESLHRKVAAEECEQIQARSESAEMEGNLKHEGQDERQYRYSNAEPAGPVNRQAVRLDLHRFQIDE